MAHLKIANLGTCSVGSHISHIYLY